LLKDDRGLPGRLCLADFGLVGTLSSWKYALHVVKAPTMRKYRRRTDWTESSGPETLKRPSRVAQHHKEDFVIVERTESSWDNKENCDRIERRDDKDMCITDILEGCEA
jgi:hypothetical protein